MFGNLELAQGEDENFFQRYIHRPVLSKLEGLLFLVTLRRGWKARGFFRLSSVVDERRNGAGSDSVPIVVEEEKHATSPSIQVF
jgi:hypothetical protein